MEKVLNSSIIDLLTILPWITKKLLKCSIELGLTISNLDNREVYQNPG